MSPVSAMGLFLGTLGWRDTTPSQLGVQNGGFWIQLLFGELLCWVDSIQGLGKPPRTSDISPKPSIPEPESSDQTSDSAADPDIDPSLFKDPQYGSRSGSNDQYFEFPATLQIGLICRNIQAEVYPFLEASPFRELPFLRRSIRNFQVYFPSLRPRYCRHIAVLTARSTSHLLPNLHTEGFTSLPAKRQGNARMDLPRNLAKDFIRNSSSPRATNRKRLYYKYGQFRISGNAFRFSKRSRPVPTDDELVVSSYDQRKSSIWAISFRQMELPWTIKISAVQDWPAPKKVRELQVFLGFTNFYRALVSGYSDITCHLTKLLKKDVPFSWGPEQEPRLKVKGRICSTRIFSPSK
ncbi:hypothetical protein BASA60_010095 [Batrachochytrium salamandrivorans]|nr:hypothetical protein BASA60_010095 [Batrachochytrium salamandrivorans]